MMIEDLDKIDITSIARQSGDVTLVICDHLDWSENDGEHLLALQDKMNQAAAATFGNGIESDLAQQEDLDFARQVTVQLPSGARMRIDFATRNRVTALIGCLEFARRADDPKPNSSVPRDGAVRGDYRGKGQARISRWNEDSANASTSQAPEELAHDC